MSEMYWSVLFCLILMKIATNSVRSEPKINPYIVMEKDQTHPSEEAIEELVQNTEELPSAEPVSPGHSILQPSPGTLISASKFPQQEENSMLVYGNLDNLAITYGKTTERVLSTDFRKTNDILDFLLNPRENKYRKPLVVYIRSKPREYKNSKSQYGKQVSEEENNASEILDDNKVKVIKAIFRCSEELFGKANDNKYFRRMYYDKTHRYRERESSDSTESDSLESSSESSDYERNPGNPYTVFKDKYLQNWMWNHAMTGDHMNVNPYAPQFNSLGPSGAALFFNRKWWYYNQDDFRPFD